MSTNTPSWFARLPSVVRLPIAATLILMLVSGMYDTGEEIAAAGIWFAILGIGSSLFLLTAVVKNLPVLWNLLGMLLRGLVGERGARIVFGTLAVAFMTPCLMRTSVAIANFNTQQRATAGGEYFPLDVVDTSSVEIRLGRGACYGTCPQYTLVINGDGALRFDGGEPESILAPARTTLTRAQVAGLLAAFERVDYARLGDYSMAECYDRTDAPSVKTSLRYDGKEKVVDHYFGCDRAPDALTQLEWAIDSIAGVGEKAQATAG